MKSFVTTFCNQPHRLADGKPINHHCYVLPTAALHAEMSGEIVKAHAILTGWKKRREHRGVSWKQADEQEQGDVVAPREGGVRMGKHPVGLRGSIRSDQRRAATQKRTGGTGG